ncbi:MAG: hypothetical protein GXX79_17160 [Actinomycetales bacterium]|nr:hypothetical protein [Actinomycetales bacterium]
MDIFEGAPTWFEVVFFAAAVFVAVVGTLALVGFGITLRKAWKRSRMRS